jgi:hypothetical protein
MSAPPQEDDFWGPVIHSYSRAQAIADGFLVDLSTFSFRPGLTILQEVGIKYPVAMTRAAYCLTIQEDGEELPPCQDLSGRMWDVVYMMKMAIKRTDGPELHFCLHVQNWNKARTRGVMQKITLKAICGPGDTPEPIITIMLPEES